jgi:hypothetical protein
MKTCNHHKIDGQSLCLPDALYGEAVAAVIDIGGKLFVTSQNNEYASQVNFCPWCGKPAAIPVDSADCGPINNAAKLTPEKISAIAGGGQPDWPFGPGKPMRFVVTETPC